MLPRQTRVLTGFALIAAAAVVALIGYLGVSEEIEVAFQLPYFASAGVAAVLLVGLGATSLLSAQLERDGARLDELEQAVRMLSAEVGRLADGLEPPRRRLEAADLTDELPVGNGKRAKTAAARR